MIPHAVNFDPLVVVDVQVALLGYGKHRMVLKEAHVVDLLLGLEFYHEVLSLPIKHCKVAFLTSKQNMPTIFCH